MAAPALMRDWRFTAASAVMGAIAAFGVDGSLNKAHANELGPDCQYSQQAIPVGGEYRGVSNTEVAQLGVRINDYIKQQNSGVGVLVLIDDIYLQAGLTPEHAANTVHQKLQEEGIDSLVCYAHVDGNRGGITFGFGDKTFGPYQPSDAIGQIPNVAHEFRVENPDSVAGIDFDVDEVNREPG